MGIIKSAGSFVGGILILFLFILNTFGGIIGGVWLLCIGEWRLVLSTFLVTLFMPLAFSLIMLPAFGLSLLGIKAIENDNIIGLIISCIIATLYTYVILLVWSLFVFAFFNYRHYEFGISYVPLLLWEPLII